MNNQGGWTGSAQIMNIAFTFSWLLRDGDFAKVQQIVAKLRQHAIDLGGKVGDLILCEVLQRFRIDRDFATARRALLSFPVFEMVGVALAEKAAANYRRLRRRGVTVRRTVDVLIATFVIERGFSLLHNDADFDGFEQELGLQVFRGDEAGSALE